MIESIVLGLSLYTWHVPREYDCSPCGTTNSTPGLYVMTEDYTAGYVRNSLGRPSWYAGKMFHAAGLDFTVGAITGYRQQIVTGSGPKCKKRDPCLIERGTTSAVLRPLVAASYQFDLGTIKPRLTILGDGLHVSLEYKWK